MNFTYGQIYDSLKRNIRFIALITAICVVLGLLLSFVIPKKYKSSGSFYIVNSSMSSGGADILKGLISDGGFSETRIYIENLIQTRFIMDNIIEKTSLMEKKNIGKRFMAYEWLKANVTVSPLKDGMILINAIDNDPEFATHIVNSYLDVIDSFYKQSEVFLARNYRKYLELRERELFIAMNSYLDSLKAFQKRENLVYPEIEYQAYYTNIIMPLKQELTNQLINKEKSLMVANDKVSSEQFEREYRITESVIESLYEGSGSGRTSLTKLPAKIKEYAALKIQSDISISLYSTVKAELEKAVMNEKNNVPSIFIIDEGVIPETHFFPKKRDGLILGFLIGLILSSGYTLYREDKKKNA
ncbi:MAG: hypothetical protein AB7T10_01900 [bacterium]